MTTTVASIILKKCPSITITQLTVSEKKREANNNKKIFFPIWIKKTNKRFVSDHDKRLLLAILDCLDTTMTDNHSTDQNNNHNEMNITDNSTESQPETSTQNCKRAISSFFFVIC